MVYLSFFADVLRDVDEVEVWTEILQTAWKDCNCANCLEGLQLWHGYTIPYMRYRGRPSNRHCHGLVEA